MLSVGTMQAADVTETRFAFGRNWAAYVSRLTDQQIEDAERSLVDLLETPSLTGRSFLDIGSGSGLFSLAARRLGARVHSFDYDQESVGCTAELQRRYFPLDRHWVVEQGSALDARYLAALGTFDVVYSWGVLHHTGQMWQALAHAAGAVSPGGRLVVALYNDAGGRSARWVTLKRIYNALPAVVRPVYAALVMLPAESKTALAAVLRGRLGAYVQAWTAYGAQKRGMSRWRDIIDWVGGYPYEYARADAVFAFYHARGFTLERLVCAAGPLGCNQFVFRRH